MFSFSHGFFQYLIKIENQTNSPTHWLASMIQPVFLDDYFDWGGKRFVFEIYCKKLLSLLSCAQILGSFKKPKTPNIVKQKNCN